MFAWKEKLEIIIIRIHFLVAEEGQIRMYGLIGRWVEEFITQSPAHVEDPHFPRLAGAYDVYVCAL